MQVLPIYVIHKVNKNTVESMLNSRQPIYPRSNIYYRSLLANHLVRVIDDFVTRSR